MSQPKIKATVVDGGEKAIKLKDINSLLIDYSLHTGDLFNKVQMLANYTTPIYQLVEAEKEKPNGVICGEGADIFFNYKQATPSSKGSEESVTKAAHEAVNPNSPTWQIELEYFEKGWNKATQQQGLVSLERVVELMENRIIRLQEMALSKLESETLINENEYMLIKLKTLKQ